MMGTMPLLSFAFLETAAQPHSTIALRVAMTIHRMLYSFLGAMGLGGAIFFCAVPCCWVVWKQRWKRAHEWRMSSRSLEGRIRRTEATFCVERTTTKTVSLSCESTHDGSSDEFTYTVYDLIFKFLALDRASVHFNVCRELRGQIGARLREQLDRSQTGVSNVLYNSADVRDFEVEEDVDSELVYHPNDDCCCMMVFGTLFGGIGLGLAVLPIFLFEHSVDHFAFVGLASFLLMVLVMVLAVLIGSKFLTRTFGRRNQRSGIVVTRAEHHAEQIGNSSPDGWASGVPVSV